jgi:HD-GYP domain-containing protein (c-di-GMP phosphodiesterase class II)
VKLEQDNELLFEVLQSFFIERDTTKLCEIVLNKAMELTNADGGTLYLVDLEDPQLLNFSIVINHSLDIYMGGLSGHEITFPSIELICKDTGEKNHQNVASHSAVSHELLNIEDAYASKDFDFSGMKTFDERSGYHSKSFLVVPLLNHSSEVVGVIQLINACDENGKVIGFSKEYESIIGIMSNFAALALDNALLSNEKNQVLINLLAERDVDKLLENVLREAMKICHADGGTLYMLKGEAREAELVFECLINKSLNTYITRQSESNRFAPLPLFNEQGEENNQTIACFVANHKQILNIEDIYENPQFDSSGAKAFDQNTGYRTQSLLVIPLLNHDNDVIGVIQLINASEPANDQTIAFAPEHEPVITALTQYAAIVVNLQILLEDHRLLLDSVVQCIAGAIDAKSPHTSAHCQQIPVIMDMMVDAISHDREHFPEFFVEDEQRYEIQVASWLHDCGKLTTPDSVLEKSTKLHKMADGIHEVNNRFTILKQQTQIEFSKKILDHTDKRDSLTSEMNKRLEQLEDDRAFIESCNKGGEFMSEEYQERVKQIAELSWKDHSGIEQNMLSEDEVYNLCIARGTITKEERDIINNHMQVTIDMLNSLHFPKDLKQVPEIAGGHHEKMNGNGFPKGLTRDEMSIPARMMAIADIFEALTSKDRPYKDPMKLSQALSIMNNMVGDEHIDPDIFAVFLKQGVWKRYAQGCLNPEQLDIEDITPYL